MFGMFVYKRLHTRSIKERSSIYLFF